MPDPRAAPAPLVAHVDAERGFSGGEAQVFLLLEGLRARGWRNVLVCPRGSAAAAQAKARGIETRHVEMRNGLDLFSVLLLRLAFRAGPAALVHLHTGRATWLGSLAAGLAGVPAIATRRMDRAVVPGWRTRLVYERLLRHVVAISPAVRRCLTEGGVAESRVSVIPSAVELPGAPPEGQREETRRGLSVAGDQAVVLVLAALVRRKGVDVLLEAFAALAEEGLRPTLWIAGDGPERPALETSARRLGLPKQVRFLGRRSDIAALLAAADVVAVPSRHEGLGVAALEAMASGRPVVGSAVGGLAEAVVDGRTGLLVPPGDAAALARALARVLRDPELRAALGREGQLRVAEGYSAEQMVDAYVRLYEKVLREWRERRHRA